MDQVTVSAYLLPAKWLRLMPVFFNLHLGIGQADWSDWSLHFNFKVLHFYFRGRLAGVLVDPMKLPIIY